MCWCSGNKFRNANVRQNACSAASDGRLTDKTYHGHTHPKGIACRDSSAPGERIKGDVDPPVSFHVLGPRLLVGELQAIE